jgi:hypothetical protein
MKIKIYDNEQVAKMCGCQSVTAKKYAQTHDIAYLGNSKRKIYVWFEEDIEEFKKRDTTPGRKTNTQKYQKSIENSQIV